MTNASIFCLHPTFPAKNLKASFFKEIDGFKGGDLRQNDFSRRD